MGNEAARQSTDAVLRERVKELTCLYSIAQITGVPGKPLDEILQGIVEVLPPAWQYSDIASARITMDGHSYCAPGYHPFPHKQTADIVIESERRGVVEVVYRKKKNTLDEGPFLREERNLIDAVAAQVALIVKRKEMEEKSVQLQDQLRHADRLATIGQLAAGVAHELNEPLGNILGFAQLAKKYPDLPPSPKRDMEKIESAAFNAREIIRKLLVFARQVTPHKEQVSLNQVIKDGLFFFEARCAKAGIEIECALQPELPAITADAAQMNQVLVNLVVNALQAMPEGGKLTIQTRASDSDVFLIVQDTGEGMSEEVLKRVFVPFFTTKDVGEGTGLGLSMVHGIVTSHGGKIKIESKAGCGARFEIQLPMSFERSQVSG